MDDRRTNPEPPFSWAAMESRSGEPPVVGRVADLSGSSREVIRQEIARAFRLMAREARAHSVEHSGEVCVFPTFMERMAKLVESENER